MNRPLTPILAPYSPDAETLKGSVLTPEEIIAVGDEQLHYYGLFDVRIVPYKP